MLAGMTAAIAYVTAASKDDALRIARTLVDERLAACGNVLDGMTSVYRWQGAFETASEAVLIVKTRAELIPSSSASASCTHISVPASCRGRLRRAIPITCSGSPTRRRSKGT